MAEKTEAKGTKRQGWKKPRANAKKTTNMTKKEKEISALAQEQKSKKTKVQKPKSAQGKSPTLWLKSFHLAA